jgi:hypothetical protein
MPTPPAHLSERTFRRFEPYIRKAVASSPTPVTITPIGLRPVTFAARMRDAIRSFSIYRWQSDIPLERFLELYERRDLTTTLDDGGMVIIGPLGQGKTLAPAGQIVDRASHNNEMSVWTNPNPLELRALCILLSNRRIPGPFRLTLCPDEVIEQVPFVEENFDVAVTKVNDHTIEIF